MQLQTNIAKALQETIMDDGSNHVAYAEAVVKECRLAHIIGAPSQNRGIPPHIVPGGTAGYTHNGDLVIDVTNSDGLRSQIGVVNGNLYVCNTGDRSRDAQLSMDALWMVTGDVYVAPNMIFTAPALARVGRLIIDDNGYMDFRKPLLIDTDLINYGNRSNLGYISRVNNMFYAATVKIGCNHRETLPTTITGSCYLSITPEQDGDNDPDVTFFGLEYVHELVVTVDGLAELVFKGVRTVNSLISVTPENGHVPSLQFPSADYIGQLSVEKPCRIKLGELTHLDTLPLQTYRAVGTGKLLQISSFWIRFDDVYFYPILDKTEAEREELADLCDMPATVATWVAMSEWIREARLMQPGRFV